MTKKEAIKVLNMVEAHGLADEAKRMAIKALDQPPCEDAISRQAVLDIDFKRIILTTAKPAEMIEQKVKALPSINPQPKTGHWIGDEFGSKCSCCGIHTHLDKFNRPMKFKYCSMCGAKMVESQENEDK